MKKTLLFKAALFGAVSAFTLGAVLAPLTSFASEASDSASAEQALSTRASKPNRSVGIHGVVTAVNDAGNESGTISFTLAKPERPSDAPELDEDVLARIRERIEAFFEAHPDAPRAGDVVTVAYDSSTKFMIGGVESSAADIDVGTTIYVMGAKPNSDQIAKGISDTPRSYSVRNNHPGRRGVAGEVLSVDAEANTVTITLPDQADSVFSVGQRVRVGAPLHTK